MPFREGWRRVRRGPWRVAVAEESMTPALKPGDWLLLDPAPRRWPKRGSVVVVRQPGTEQLAVKRIAAGPGDVVLAGTGYITLGDEAWLLGDGGGHSVDSRHYGPVPLEALVGRAWFRYWPPRRIGLVPRRRASSARARASIASKGKLRK
jgi:signal peptidase I